MWAAHQVHHSSEDYNLATALRQSVLQAYSSWVGNPYFILTCSGPRNLYGFLNRTLIG